MVSLSETSPGSSAEAECVKVALVSLKECVQVGGEVTREREEGKHELSAGSEWGSVCFL